MEQDPRIEGLRLEAIEQLERKIWGLFHAVKACLDERLWEPGLILFYSVVDALAWLDCPREQADVTRADFMKWVTTYLLPIPGADCTAADLYAARCGLLHTHTAESKLSRNARAKRVFYHRVVAGEIIGVINLRMSGKLEPAWVDVDALLQRFEQGLVRFAQDLAADPDRFTCAAERVLLSYLSEVVWHESPAIGVQATVRRKPIDRS